MKNDDSNKQTQPLEGEGSYTATRRYNQHLGDAIDSGDVEAAADAARRAVEGPEGPRRRLESPLHRGNSEHRSGEAVCLSVTAPLGR
jgi:hypothetical protein